MAHLMGWGPVATVTPPGRTVTAAVLLAPTIGVLGDPPGTAPHGWDAESTFIRFTRRPGVGPDHPYPLRIFRVASSAG